MNALLSRPILDAVSFFIGTSPGGAASQNFPGGPLAPYRPVGVLNTENYRGRWTYPEFFPDVARLPQLVTGSGQKAFTAYWL
jgi:hypothetical protein